MNKNIENAYYAIYDGDHIESVHTGECPLGLDDITRTYVVIDEIDYLRYKPLN